MKIILLGFLCAMLYSCSSPRITTTWKAEPVHSENYRRILVVTILPEADSLLRKTIEAQTVSALNSMGYQAKSAVSTFGPKGLAASGEEDTYLKLCTSGIDAVLTFALISEESHYAAINPYMHSNNYYYNRIWSYKKMQADTINTDPEIDYFWESMLFDLATLEAVSTIRTRTFTKDGGQKITNDLADLVIRKMTKEKVLEKKNSNLKAF